MTPKTMEEAIIGLQLEADGIVSNLRRDSLAVKNNISGLDFMAELPNGKTIFVEVKGPVDSRIKRAENQDPSLTKQARSNNLAAALNAQRRYFNVLRAIFKIV